VTVKRAVLAEVHAALLKTSAALDAALDHLAGSSEFSGGALTAWMEEARDEALDLHNRLVKRVRV
jgi:hypothetical protein